MRAVRFHEPGPPSVLSVDETDRPTPDDHEILVEVQGASINPVDAKRRGDWTGAFPKVTGSDFAGIVAEVGKDVDGFAHGDRVFGTGFFHERFQTGSCAEYVAVPIDVVAKLPDNVDTEVAATMGIVGVTAWEAIVNRATLTPGDACLIHGGSGGVGHIAVQLAAAMGARTVATAGSSEGLELIKDAGADVALDYNRDSLETTIVEATDGGPDVILQPRLDHYFQFDIDVAANWADIAVIDGEGTVEDGHIARRKNLTYHFVSMSHFLDDPNTPMLRSVLERLVELMSRDDLETRIGRRYPLERTEDAHHDVMNERINGKILIEP